MEINRAQVLLVNQFWILDFGFWIDPNHKVTWLKDFKLMILDLFRPRSHNGTKCGAKHEPKNLKFKI
ncbi:hypothetical protein COO91_04571 [Nostoc flagelliforme CCNUN1]|uniref:Uncharacterized protein n=1 Tax=Nostoc flagelliforme CCNUN1 TaxID=2038116 RepID=A0A2K8ST39_9NOSO|nr:hypothetical protein COO91_04571 [Nostoc flagelliforme CCNUN1]